MGKQPAPTPPNVQQTAQAQTTSNRETAITQAGLNAVNQSTPQGSLSYKQIGTWPDGTPRFEATTALTGDGQQLFETGQQTSQNLANVAKEQSGRLSGLLAAPFSLDNDATEGRLMELASKRLDPQLDRRREAEITRLSNMGIKLGSTAYDRAIEGVNQSEVDARNRLLLTGRNQAVQEAMLERQTPINEILALAGQNQLQQPNFTSTPQTGVAGTDVAGIAQAGYQNQYNAWNQQQQQNNQLLGGLFGLAGNAAMAFSDARVKRDIKRIGTTVNGLPWYEFNYIWDAADEPIREGLMSADVREYRPEAVVIDRYSGFDKVNYSLALEAA